MTDIHVTQADRDKAADAYENQFALWGGDLARQVSDLTRSGGRDDTLLVQAFARHRIEATLQSQEQIKLLREARDVLEQLVRRTPFRPVEGGISQTMPFEQVFKVRDTFKRIDAALEATNG